MKYHFLQMYIKRNRARKNNGKRGCGCCSTFVSSFMITKKQCEKTFCIFLNCMATEFCLRKRQNSGTALEKYGLMDNPVSLAWRYYENTQQCLQFNPSELYCCEAASPVQIDGFWALMDNAAFVRYISGKSIHIELSEESKTEYLEEWSADCPDVTHIKEICRKAIGNNEKKEHQCVA